MKYLIGLDIGTSSVKGILIAEDGSRQFTEKGSFEYDRPVEKAYFISAEEYLRICFGTLRKLTAQLPEDGEICGLCAASASGNLLLLGPDGKPSTPIFNWQTCITTNDRGERVLGADFDAEAHYRKVGWGFVSDGVGKFPTCFPVAELCRLNCESPELVKNASAVCMSTEYLYRALTGAWGITTSAGTPSYMIDQVTGEYITDVLDKLGVPLDKVPPVGKVGDKVGEVTAEAAAETGLPVGTPVFLGTFDHPSAARGVGVLEEGQLLLSCGTSWVAFYPVKDREKALASRMLTDPFLSEKGGCWAGLISVASISGRIEKYVRFYLNNGTSIYKTFAEEAAKSCRGAGGLVLDLTAEPDPAIAERYPKHHIARAIMEGTIRLLKQKMDALQAGGISATSAVMVGGPTENPVWKDVLEQMTGLQIEIRQGSYAGAVGSAIVAGISAGIFPDEATGAKILQ